MKKAIDTSAAANRVQPERPQPEHIHSESRKTPDAEKSAADRPRREPGAAARVRRALVPGRGARSGRRSGGAEGDLERHDRYTFEAKIDYVPDPAVRRNTYLLSFYFFVPGSLKINRQTYSKAEFYNDIYTYIRFRTPRFTLEELLDPGNDASPLSRLERTLGRLGAGARPEPLYRTLMYELRLLATVHKTSFRSELRPIVSSLESRSGKSREVAERTRRLIALSDELLGRLSEIRNSLEPFPIPRELEETYTFACDYIGIVLQDGFTLLIDRYRKDGGKRTKTVVERLVSRVEREIKRRTANGSPLVRDTESDNEDFTYWEGILKRYFQSVLFLEIKDRRQAQTALQVFYAIAAGVAMLLSLLLGFWIGSVFRQESVGFIFALVLAYMVKDRIKDGIRLYSNRLIRMLFHDRKLTISDPSNSEPIGTITEHMRFVPDREVPDDVRKARTAGNLSLIEAQGKREEIIVYEKAVSLDTGRMDARSGREAVHDIIRFNVRNFIQYADDPVKFERVWHPASGRIKRAACSKVYHLNLIIKIETPSGSTKEQVAFKHVRVILNQDGILRVSGQHPSG